MMVMKTNLYIVKHAQLLEQTDILEGSRDACLIDLDCLVTGNVLSIQQNPSAIRLVHARQKVENSRFTSAVRSDQAVELSFFYRDAEIIDRFQTAKRNT